MLSALPRTLAKKKKKRKKFCVSSALCGFLYGISFHPHDPLKHVLFSSVQFSSVTQSCPTLRDPMDHSMPGLPVHHQLPESTQTRVH